MAGNTAFILYDINGNQLAVQSGTATPANTSAIMIAGSDGTNSRYVSVDGSGNTVMVGAGIAGTPAGGIISIQGVSGGTTIPITITGSTGGLALDSSVNGILLAQGSTTSGQFGPLIQGAVTTSAPSYTTAKTSPLSLTTSGLLRVDGSGVTQPISGTVTANAGTGTFTISGTVIANIGTTNGLALDSTLAKLTIAQGTALGSNTQALIGGSVTTAAPTYTTGNINPLSLTTSGLLRVDGSGVTQPISGTITANIGTTGGLALDTTVSGLQVSQGSTTSGQKGDLILGAVTTAAPSYTTGQTNPLSLTTAGLLRVDGSGVTQPISGTVTANQGGAPWSSNITQFGGVNISTGTGASGTGIPRVTVSNDSNILATQSGTWTVQQGGAPWTITGTLSDNTTNSTAKIAVIAAKANTSAPSWTDGNQAPLSVIAGTGALRSDVSSWLGSTAPTVGSKTSANSIPVVIASDQGSTPIGDGTNGPVAVKPASTAAVATDLALVVAISPNNSIATTIASDVSPATQNITVQDTSSSTTSGANNQSIITGTPTTNSAASFTLASKETVQIQVTGTWTGTLQVEASQDSGTTWYIRKIHQTGTDIIGSSFTANFSGALNSGAYTNCRIRATAAMTGTATIKVNESLNNNVIYLNNALRITDNAGNYTPAMDTAARKSFMAVTDGTNTAAVKAASTAAVATDPALVVAISPNNSITTSPASGSPDVTASGSFGALNNTVQVALSGLRGAAMQLSSGTLLGTLVAEYSTDGGTTWNLTSFYDSESGLFASSVPVLISGATFVRNIVVIPGSSHARVRVSAYTSGSSSCALRASTVESVRKQRTSVSNRLLNDSSKTVLLLDTGEVAATNTSLWTTAKVGTGTIADIQLTNDTTSGHYVILTSNPWFYATATDPLIVCFVTAAVYTTNAIVDFGLGSVAGSPTSAAANGTFFQVDGSGVITGTVSTSLSTRSVTLGTFGSGGFVQYAILKWIIELTEYGTRFLIEDFNGNVLADAVISFPDNDIAGGGSKSVSNYLREPIFARVYNTGAAGTGAFFGNSITAYRLDTATTKDWPTQMAGTSRNAAINPTSFAQTPQLAAGAAPTTGTPTNTTVRYTTLGGEFSLNNTATSENLLGVFGFQIPGSFSFYLTELVLPPPVVTTGLGATVEIQEWCLMHQASSTNPSTATGFRTTIGLFSAAASAAAGTVFNGQTINIRFSTPLVIYQAQYLLVLVKNISGSSTGVYRGSILINGYFE